VLVLYLSFTTFLEERVRCCAVLFFCPGHHTSMDVISFGLVVFFVKHVIMNYRRNINRPTKRGKDSLHLMDTINAKKKWTNITGVSIFFEKETHSDALC
jgi:hypothetical protein